jgi:polyisoprenoid-binding protein YceI
MNKINQFLPFLMFLGLFFGFTACGGNSSEQKEDTTTDSSEITKKVKEKCTYTYLDTATTVAWFAFKFTEKTEVGGKFDRFEVLSQKEANSPKEILSVLEFKIATNSVNTTNPDRDKKIVASFFGTLSKTDQITGKVVSMDGDDESGTATLKLGMNEIEKEIKLDYKITENKISLSGKIDVADWKAMSGIEALNKICYDLHKGKDGVSKLWSEVRLDISSELTKNCQ